jgi:hypothetical protein
MAELSHPEIFGQAHLLASDFDNTVALTSELLPGGRTVEEAYEHAIYQVFGQSALRMYSQGGGLRNRSPLEVVAELSPQITGHLRQQKTEDLVGAKMAILLPQFGQRLPDGRLWPPPVEGMPGVWSRLSVVGEVTTAIITSGHDAAVERFFDIHELPQPDITVTDDDMRPLAEKLPSHQCVKPSRLLIDCAHHKWLEILELESLADQDHVAYLLSRERLTYVGDDRRKDGRMAIDAGVDFVHIPKDNPAPAWRHIGHLIAPAVFEGDGRV